MKLIVLNKDNPFAGQGAANNRLLGLLRGLNRQSVEVEILILQGYKTKHEKNDFSGAGNIDGIKYYYISKRDNISIWQKRFSEYIYYFIEPFFVNRKIESYLKQEARDTIIWLQNNALCYRLVRPSSKIYDYKIFVEMNEYPDVHKGNNSTKYIWQRIYSDRKTQYFYKNVINRLDGFALMTEALISYFEDKLSKNTKVLHLPMTVEIDRFDLTKSYNQIREINSPYIGFVGSMNDAKDGVNILIEAFALISKDFPTYKLALFGFWAYDSIKHLNRIQELGLQDRVVYSKPIDTNRVVDLIMNAVVLVLPRPDSYQARGGFPTKLGEYLASSKPVIVTPVGEIPNYLTDNVNAFFVGQGSILSLSEKLRVVLSDLSRAKEIGRNGRIVAEKQFSVDFHAVKLYHFLQSI